MEALIMSIPVGAILFIPIALNLHSVYEWSHEGFMQTSEVLKGKSGYLNESAFTIRAAIEATIEELHANHFECPSMLNTRN